MIEKKYYIPLLCLGVLSSCERIKEKPHLIYPSPNAEIRNPVYLQASSDVNWLISGKDAGFGKVWSGFLPHGTQIISINNDSNYSIFVRPQIDMGEIRNLTPEFGKSYVNLDDGLYDIVISNTTKEIINLSGLNNSGHSSELSNSMKPDSDIIPDFSEKLYSIINSKLEKMQSILNSTKGGIKKSSASNIDTRDFFVANISNDGNSSIKVNSKLVFSDKNVLSYVDTNDLRSFDNRQIDYIESIMENFSKYIFPFMQKTYGDSSDVDENKKVIILFTSMLNKSKLAVGFFNPADLIRKTIDNTESNESEILYVGIPSIEKNDINFNPKSIEATLCHEYQHLINFSQKTLPYLESQAIPTEDISVNEGLSHLAEDLCGYNRLGGNIAFVEKYLNNSHTSSLDNIDLNGRGDTIERRGAMYLYLRYLYEKQQNPDNWLKKILTSKKSGIANVAEQSKMNITQSISYFQWAVALAGRNPPVKFQYQPPLTHSVTRDSVGINLMGGNILIGEDIAPIHLNGITEQPEWPKKIAPHGFIYRKIRGPATIYLPQGIQLEARRTQ